MKLKAIIILFLNLLIQINCLGQSQINNYNSLKEWNTDTVELHKIIEENFIGGVDKFYRTLYYEIQYPIIALRNCKEGVMLLQLSLINNEQQIEIQNKIGSEFDEEIEAAFKRIKNNWKTNNLNKTIRLSIRFSINPHKEKIKNEFTTLEFRSYETGGSLICDAQCDYRTTEHLKEKVNYSIDYSDFESAILYLKELKRRFPFNKEYQKLYEETWSKIKK